MPEREMQMEQELARETAPDPPPMQGPTPTQAPNRVEDGSNVPLDLPASLLPESREAGVEEELHLPDGGRREPSGPLWERALRTFVDANWKMSARLNHWAAAWGRKDGWYEHPAKLSELLEPGMSVVDLGSGSNPAIPLEEKRRLGLHVIGVDIRQDALDAAPAGGYDEAVCGDAETFSRAGVADLVISRALAEHLRHPEKMFQRTWELLKDGGETLHFIPNRHAVFAHLNRIIPERTKRSLLHTIYPLSRGHLGFEAFYRSCTPAGIRSILEGIGFRDIHITPYFCSNYFVAYLPAHAAMLGWQMTAMGLRASELCENFIVYARKGR